MKAISMVLLCGALAIAASNADTGISGSFIEIEATTASTSTTVYKGENSGSVPNIEGADFGVFLQGDTLKLTKSQINTFETNGGDVTGGELAYRVYPTGPTSAPFQTSIHAFQSNAPFTNLGGSTVTGSGDQAWGNSTPIDLLPTTPGVYTLEVYFRAVTNEGDRYSNQGGANFKATFTVTYPVPLLVSNVNNSGPGSLRQAVADASANSTPDIITFAPGLTGPVILGSQILAYSTHRLIIDATALPGGITIDGGAGTNRIFEVGFNANVTLSNLTLTGGNGDGSTNSGYGGAIMSRGTLMLTNCTLSGNSASSSGGGIACTRGSLTVNQSSISGNSATSSGGGIYYDGFLGSLTVNQSTIVANTSSGIVGGGGIYNDGTATVNQSTISGNSSGGSGGGIYNWDTLTLNQSTVSENSSSSGGGIHNIGVKLMANQSTISENTANALSGQGGGIYNFSTSLATLNECTLSGNSAGGIGGGITNSGTLTVNQCTLSGNTTGSSGGGIHNGGPLTMTQTTLSGNTAVDYGGGLMNYDPATVDRCTFSGNSAGDDGGGIYNGGSTITINQSTFFGNSADNNGDGLFNEGGGIYNSGTITVNQSTLSANMARWIGGGLYNNGTLNLHNSILAGNTAPSDENLRAGSIFFPTGLNLTSGDPLLAPLGNYGGPAQTMALRPGSPARNAATGSTIIADQRGFPIVGAPDVGAYEAGTFNNYNAYIWETLPATATTPETVASFDFDGDGISNLIEYALGTSPVAPSVMPAASVFENAGKRYIQLVWTRPDDRGDTVLVGETSADLSDGSWSPASVSTIVSTGPGSQTIEFVFSEPIELAQRRFLRVRVVLPSGP